MERWLFHRIPITPGQITRRDRQAVKHLQHSGQHGTSNLQVRGDWRMQGMVQLLALRVCSKQWYLSRGEEVGLKLGCSHHGKWELVDGAWSGELASLTVFRGYTNYSLQSSRTVIATSPPGLPAAPAAILTFQGTGKVAIFPPWQSGRILPKN